jgi:hypothetical protein
MTKNVDVMGIFIELFLWIYVNINATLSVPL